MKKTIIVLCATLIPLILVAQSPIRLMSYNLLNFPEPNPAGKEDTLASILAFHPVDLLLVQEMRFQTGVDLILNNSLNINGETRFSPATWVPMQSNPNSTHKLQQMLFYDHEKFILHNESYVLTQSRDLNNYTLYLNDPDLSVTQDTTWLDIYVIHLKSSQGSTNVQIRANMVDSLLQHIASKPSDRNVIVAGDFNVYTGSEPAFQNLIDAGNHVVLNDPINTVGDWHANPTYAEVHTQSTRISRIFNDGAGGGMDDRFDHVLLSSSLMNGSEGISYLSGTFEALGNSGDCYDVNITSCSNSQTPQNILWSLYYMSDHLPIVLDLETSISIGTNDESGTIGSQNSWFDNYGNLNIELSSLKEQHLELNVLNTFGQEVYNNVIDLLPGEMSYQFDLSHLSTGIYIITLKSIDVIFANKAFKP